MLKKIIFFLIMLLLPACFISAQDSTHKKESLHVLSDSIPERAEENVLSYTDIANVHGLPFIGKWMYTSDFSRAHWLGVLWEKKALYEPINIIILDSLSKTPEEAVKRLNERLAIAGYTSQDYHSSGYYGFIGNKHFPQLPAKQHHCYADGPSYVPNNHGRIFGPCLHNGMFVFTGAFSREALDTAAKIKHRYDSFDRARDAFSQRFNATGAGTIIRFVNLNNAIVNHPYASTGDHDGVAVVLKLN